MAPSRIRLRGKDKVSLFSDLSTMLTAGIPIAEIIESLEADSGGKMKRVLKEMRHSLNNGEPLSKAMERFPNTFDTVTINIMRAAETGGTLEETLQYIVKNLKKQVAFAESIRIAMIYPIFIGVIFTGIILLMLTFVIPRISKVFSSMHVNMPPVTRAMIAASDYFVAHWVLISIAFVCLIIAMYMLISMNRRAVIRGLLSVPGLRRLGTNIDLLQVTRSFALLVHAGVPLDESITLSKRVVHKKQILAAIEQMQRNVEGGRPLANGIREGKSLIPPIMARSIETAETSGTLEQTLQTLAEYFDEQVAESFKVVNSLLEPIMIVVIGLMVGSLMATIIAPIYNLISQVNSL